MINRYHFNPHNIIVVDKDTDMLAGLSANIPNRWLISSESLTDHSATHILTVMLSCSNLLSLITLTNF